MSQYSHLPYRPCVGLMLLNKAGEVFVARRIDMRTEAWQMPQGGIDEGETPEQAALRELKEEIGTNQAEIIAEYGEWLNYDLPEHLVPQIWDGKYRGQTQKWFVLRYHGTDADIDIETETPEFSEWKWVQMHQLPELIVPFKRELYQKLANHFSSLVA